LKQLMHTEPPSQPIQDGYAIWDPTRFAKSERRCLVIHILVAALHLFYVIGIAFC
jgi:hypothetical protein